jgi:hypothetical protein
VQPSLVKFEELRRAEDLEEMEEMSLEDELVVVVGMKYEDSEMGYQAR